jgi:hypothetical protein
MRCLGIDPGQAKTATATLIHSDYPMDNINLDIPRGPRDVIDKRYRKEQSRLKVNAGILDIEDRLVKRKPVKVKLVSDEDVDKKDVTQITNISNDLSEPEASNNTSTNAMEKAILEFNSNLEAQLVSTAKESSTLRAFYSSERFKQDLYDYREACRHDLDKATTSILKLRSYVPDRQPTDEDLEKIIHAVDEDIDSAQLVVDGLPNTTKYD